MIQDHGSERPLKRKKKGKNIDSLNFTQEREPRDIKDVINEQRRQFKKAVRAEKQAKQEFEQIEPGADHIEAHFREESFVENNYAGLLQSSDPSFQAEEPPRKESSQQAPKSIQTNDSPLDESYYEIFQANYPDYTGSRNSFLKVLTYIEWLILAGRPPPRFVWDDFVRAFIEYGEHLKNCRAAGRALPTYIEYYSMEVVEPKYTKKIITPQNLREAFAVDKDKADEYRRSFQRNTTVVQSQPGDGSEDLGASTQSQLPLEATTDAENCKSAELPGSTFDITSRGNIGGTQSEEVKVQSDFAMSSSPKASAEEPHAMELYESETEVALRPATIIKKRFFETVSQMPKAVDTVIITDQSDGVYEQSTPRIDGVMGTPKTRSSRRLPWAVTAASCHEGEISTKDTTVRHRHELVHDVTTPLKSNAAHSFSSPILGNVDDSPIPTLSRTNPKTAKHSQLPSRILPPQLIEVTQSKVSKPKSRSKSIRSTPSDVEKVEGWLEAQSESAPSEDRPAPTPDSGPLSIVEIRKNVRESLASRGKKEAAVADVVQYYIPKRPRRSRRYSILSTPTGEGTRRDSGKSFEINVDMEN